ncbi:hypothetical protein NDU88_005894 [Pleurodeles waltl]|uniref:LIM zinc-binding domain-containing protein n=1 Tax=Pleurodeles waltl TaxID=8319 RepID=A0AAV7VN23_PLEWA|nr:hypothetical protein NDU88_005894 [Pleurodeles waltl]
MAHARRLSDYRDGAVQQMQCAALVPECHLLQRQVILQPMGRRNLPLGFLKWGKPRDTTMSLRWPLPQTGPSGGTHGYTSWGFQKQEMAWCRRAELDAGGDQEAVCIAEPPLILLMACGRPPGESCAACLVQKVRPAQIKERWAYRHLALWHAGCQKCHKTLTGGESRCRLLRGQCLLACLCC